MGQNKRRSVDAWKTLLLSIYILLFVESFPPPHKHQTPFFRFHSICKYLVPCAKLHVIVKCIIIRINFNYNCKKRVFLFCVVISRFVHFFTSYVSVCPSDFNICHVTCWYIIVDVLRKKLCFFRSFHMIINIVTLTVINNLM